MKTVMLRPLRLAATILGLTAVAASATTHYVSPNSANPTPPYTDWTTAATNIQDAINAASAGDLVFVTNGIYASGGKGEAGTLTNRVALDKAMSVISVNGFQATVIQGAWAPAGGLGAGAVRCAYVSDGAVLSGFTLQNGATFGAGNPTNLCSGGAVWCTSTNAVVSNCLLTNCQAVYGAGIIYGTLNNSFVIGNVAQSAGGGAYHATLNNCTVAGNSLTTTLQDSGAGTCNGITRNSIVIGNFDGYPNFLSEDDFDQSAFNYASYFYSYTFNSLNRMPAGISNLNGISMDVQFLDPYHISATSPCRGAGSTLYASGTDLDGEPWANPPSIGCDEVVLSNRVGPLSVSVSAYQTNLLVNRPANLLGIISGRATTDAWSFGDGTVATNLDIHIFRQWANAGTYTVTFTAYNLDNPGGVSANVVVNVQALTPPQLQAAALMSNKFQFQFIGQTNANYTIQYATNLAPPIAWKTLQTIYAYSSGGPQRITDSTASNVSRFYRVLAQ